MVILWLLATWDVDGSWFSLPAPWFNKIYNNYTLLHFIIVLYKHWSYALNIKDKVKMGWWVIYLSWVYFSHKSNISKHRTPLSVVSRTGEIWVGVRQKVWKWECGSNQGKCVCASTVRLERCSCVCVRVTERNCGRVSGRPVSYCTPSCGRVGAELSVCQVDRDYTPPHLWGHYPTCF